MNLQNLLEMLLIVSASWGGISFSVFLFRRRYNPLAIYTALWAFCLCLYEIRLLRFYEIRPLGWLTIIGAWLALFAGAVIVFSFPSTDKPSRPISEQRLRAAIIVLCVVGGTAVVDQIRTLTSLFGNVLAAITINANDIYTARTENEWSTLPYVSACLLAACPLAGMYTAKRGKFTILGLLPPVLIAAWSIFSMSRLALVIALILFVTALFYAPTEVKFNRKHKIIAITAITVCLFAGFVFVSSIRGLTVHYEGETETMADLADVSPALSSPYIYFAGPPVALDQYLHSKEPPTGWWGMYTFAPIFRAARRFGFKSEVPSYEENYPTPQPINLSTYLKNVQSDFGPVGLIVFPLILGIAVAWLHRTKRTAMALCLMAFLYAVLALSFTFNIMLLGDWWIGMLAGCIAGFIVDHAPVSVPVKRRSMRLKGDIIFAAVLLAGLASVVGALYYLVVL